MSVASAPTDPTGCTASLVTWVRVSMGWTGLQAIGFAMLSLAALLSSVTERPDTPRERLAATLAMLYVVGGAVWCLVRTYHSWRVCNALVSGSLRPDFSGADEAEGRRWLRWEAITILFPTAGCPPISGIILLVVLGARSRARQALGASAAAASAVPASQAFDDPFRSTTAWSQTRVPLA